MKILAITWVNLIRLFRDRVALFFMFLFPLALVLLLGLVFGGGAFSRVGVYVADDGALGADLVDRLEALGDTAVRHYQDRAALISAVERQRLVAAVIIPAGYTRALTEGARAAVTFVAEDNQYTPAVRTKLEAAVGDQAIDVRAARFAAHETGVPFATALEAAGQVRSARAPIEVVVIYPGNRAWDPYALVASQQLVLMVFLLAMMASQQLMLSRQLGVSRRMLATPTSVATVLLGEAVGRFVFALIQSLFIVGATALLFGVRWGDPLAAGAIVLAFSLVGTGTAMLTGALVTSEAQATAVSLVIALILAAIGGAMQPLETFPAAMRTIAHVTPHAWALDAFAEVIRRDGSIAEITTELAVLVAYAAVLLAVASWALPRSIVR